MSTTDVGAKTDNLQLQVNCCVNIGKNELITLFFSISPFYYILKFKCYVSNNEHVLPFYHQNQLSVSV